MPVNAFTFDPSPVDYAADLRQALICSFEYLFIRGLAPVPVGQSAHSWAETTAGIWLNNYPQIKTKADLQGFILNGFLRSVWPQETIDAFQYGIQCPPYPAGVDPKQVVVSTAQTPDQGGGVVQPHMTPGRPKAGSQVQPGQPKPGGATPGQPKQGWTPPPGWKEGDPVPYRQDTQGLPAPTAAQPTNWLLWLGVAAVGVYVAKDQKWI